VYAELGVASGANLDLTWSRTGSPAQPSVAGDYGIVITAVGADGALGREAVLALAVLTVPPAPTPTPSPSPSATPSP